MGHKLSHKGAESDPTKVAAIREWQFQQTKLQCSASWECAHNKPCRWWSKVSTYLFQLNGSNYLVLVDRYSDYSEREPLRNTLASTVIRAMKRNFARIPDECITDNGPQFASRMLAFCSRVRVYQYKIVILPQPRKWEGRISSYDFQDYFKEIKSWGPVLSSFGVPKHAQQGYDYSPAERLMSRKRRDIIPTATSQFVPKLACPGVVHGNIAERRNRSKVQYDKRH